MRRRGIGFWLRQSMLATFAFSVVMHLTACGPEVLIAVAFAQGGLEFDEGFWSWVTEPAPNPGHHLRIVTQPSTTAGGGVAFTTQPVVEIIRDDDTVAEDDDDTNITVLIVPGTGVAGATLSGSLVVKVNNGRANFSNLSIDRAGNAYQLAFTAPSLLSASSALFNVGNGQTTFSMALLRQPGGATADNLFARQPQLELRSTTGARNVQDDFTQITANITTGTGTSGATLSGRRTVTAAAGLVTFTDLGIDLAGANYTLTFTASPILPNIVSASFNVAGLGGGNAPFTLSPPGGAATYYVSPSGNDLDPGTQALPFRTIQTASNVAVPGDIIEIADGSYPRFTISKMATLAQPIVFRSQGKALIDTGTQPSTGEAIAITNSAHVVIHGLRTINAYTTGISVTDSQFITIQSCTSANSGITGILLTRSDDCVVSGNHAFGAVGGSGIVFSGAGDRALLAGNFAHDNASHGIEVFAGSSGDQICSQCVVERNLSANNAAAGIRLCSARDSDVRNNLARDNGGFGIELSDGGQGVAFGSQNNRVHHNTVAFAAGTGDFALALLNGSTGNAITHNLFVGGARGAIRFTGNSLTGLAEDFNLLFSLDGYAVAEEVGVAMHTLATWQTTSGGGGNDLNAAPTFNDAASGDYSLSAASQGVDAGGSSAVTQTYDGGSRPLGAGFDMGCHER